MAPLKRFAMRREGERGAEFVEFALVLPILLLIVLGIIDFGFMFMQTQVITNAAREGARIRVLPNYSAADARLRVQDYLDASLIKQDGTATIAVGDPVTVSIGGKCMSTVTVTVTFPHTYSYIGGIAKFFGGTFGTRDLVATSTMRTEAAATGCP